jgi:hypothetical protein
LVRLLVSTAGARSSIPRVNPLDAPTFDELVDLLRVRLADADALNASELHSFKELMRDHAEVVADQFYWHAFEELEAQGHLDPASTRAMGLDAHGRLSADGRLYLRTQG